jgi:hypothetical protein
MPSLLLLAFLLFLPAVVCDPAFADIPAVSFSLLLSTLLVNFPAYVGFPSLSLFMLAYLRAYCCLLGCANFT